MKAIQANFFGDHNLGLFARASDRLILLGSLASEKNERRISEILGAKTEKITVAGTDFAGIFLAMNKNGIVAPNILSNREKEKLRSLTKKFGMNLTILNSKFTAIGNLILCNDRGALISRNYSIKNKEKIQDCLDVEAVQSTIARMDIVGSCGVSTNKGCLLHHDASEKEAKIVEDVLKVKVDIGTGNFGSPFVGSCMIANSNGVVVGESTTGPELSRITETLDLT